MIDPRHNGEEREISSRGYGSGLQKVWHTLCGPGPQAARRLEHGIRELRSEPVPENGLERTLEVLGLLAESEDRAANHRVRREQLRRVLLMVGLGIFVTTLAQPEQVGRQVFDRMWTHLEGAGSVAAFWALTGLFWYLKPLAALWTDNVPLFGTRRRGYLVVSALAAGALWLSMLFVPPTAGRLFFEFIGLGAMLALASTVLGGLLVEQGQRLGATGRMGCIHLSMVHLAALTAGLAGGWLTNHRFQFTPAFAASLLLALALASVCLLRDERPAKQRSRRGEAFTNARAQLHALREAKSLWIVVAFLALVLIVPNFDTLLAQVQIRAGMSAGTISRIRFSSELGSLFGIGLYFWVCKRLPLRTLLPFGISGNALGTLLYLNYAAHLTPFLACSIEAVNGVASILILVTLFDLVVRAIRAGTRAWATPCLSV